MRRAVGMAGKEWQQAHSPQNRHCRRTQPADSPPGTGLKQTATGVGLAAKTIAATNDVGLPLAVQCR